MRYFLYVCTLSTLLSLSLASCFNQGGSNGDSGGGGGLSETLCSNEYCVKNVCPSYSASVSSSTNKVCKVIGSCALPNMPLTSQLFIPSHGDMACGPTSAHMAIDSLIANSAQNTSGWLESYSVISSQVGTSSSIDGCPASDLNCKKVVMVGDKLIGTSWNESARPVAATEVESLMQELQTQVLPEAESHTSGLFPDDVQQCDFVTGTNAISDSSPWNNIFLYLNYESDLENSSSYNGAPLINVKLKNPEGGHFVTMNGYTVSTGGVMYKFHCPIYGIKWYYIQTVKIDQPFCMSYVGSECQQYANITELPLGFEDSTNNSFSYLVEMHGEEAANNYDFRVIANVSGVQ